MTLVILPRQEDQKEAARVKLQTVLDDPLTVVMVISGEGTDAERAIETCSGRASVKPNIRKVVWCPNPKLLTPAQRDKLAPSGKVAVAVGLDDKVAASLTKARAKVALYVERAFLKAEAQDA